MDVNRSGRIFIIEEEPSWRKFAAQALRARGYVVETSSNQGDSASRVERENPSLTILGFSTIGARELMIIDAILRHELEGPVLVLASSLTPKAIREVFLKGAADVARKSFEERELIEMVDNQIRTPEPKSNYALLRGRSRRNG